jgi:thioredoxin-related protein
MLRSPSWLLIPVVVALVSVAVVFSTVPKRNRLVTATTVEWHEDLDAAIQIAKRTGKDVLVNFTARRYCYHCTLLKKQVLIQQDFLNYVRSRFVLVEIDKSMLEDDGTKTEKLRRMEAWQFQYRAGSAPTVFLLDANGRPFGITHHRDGGPMKFVEFLTQCQVAREHRDKLLKQASSLTGSARAAMLDEALSAIDEALSRDVTLDEPPLTVFHDSEIDDILRLEPNAESPLHQKYARLQRDAVEAKTKKALYQKFHEIADADGNDAAVRYADELLSQTADKALIKELRSYRRFYLEHGDRFQEELDQVLDDLRDLELTADERHWLEDREKFSLGRLGRRDEALAIIDRWIVEAGNDRDKKRKAYEDKGQFQWGSERAAAARAFEAAAELSDDGSEEWWENKGMAAWGWLLNKDYATAKQALAALLGRKDLPADQKPGVLLRLIESLLALDEHAQAEDLRVHFRQAIADCPEDLLEAEDAKRLLNKCEQLFSEAAKTHTPLPLDR